MANAFATFKLILQALEHTVETLKELDDCKMEESTLQQALGWSSVASSRAEIERLERQLTVSAPQARSLAEAEREGAAAQLRQLETNMANQVRNSHAACLLCCTSQGLVRTQM